MIAKRRHAGKVVKLDNDAVYLEQAGSPLTAGHDSVSRADASSVMVSCVVGWPSLTQRTVCDAQRGPQIPPIIISARVANRLAGVVQLMHVPTIAIVSCQDPVSTVIRTLTIGDDPVKLRYLVSIIVPAY